MANLVLWHFAISHFTEKARWALDYKGVRHTRKMLYLDYPIRCYLASGQMSLPILFVDGKPIIDSTRIIEYLERSHPENPLYPDDPALHERALALEDYFDEELGPHIRAVLVDSLFEAGTEATIGAFGMNQNNAVKSMMRLAYPLFLPFYRYRHHMSPEEIDRGRQKLDLALDRLESEIGPSGYLVGDRFSVADLTAASLFYPIAFPPEYPYQPPQVSRDALAPFLEPMKGRKAQLWVAEMYRQHRGAYERLSDEGNQR
jgi:glutathione S-transferase